MLAGLAAAALVLSACGAVPTAAVHAGGTHPTTGVPGNSQARSCTTTVHGTVHGVVAGPGSLTAAWLPAGFRLHRSNPGTSSSPPSATYTKATTVSSATASGATRVSLGLSYSAGPLSNATPGSNSAQRVVVQGHPGLLDTGPPAPQLAGVYWKPAPGEVLSVVGSEMPAPEVLKVAEHVVFSPPTSVSLPNAPGVIVTRAAAIAAALRAAGGTAALRASGGTGPSARAKLSSWTEVQALLQASHYGSGTFTAPSVLVTAPWKPVWAVLVDGTEPELVVVDATSGHPLLTIPAGNHPSWFAALTDRSQRPGGSCPGESTSALPFGVLTRQEETYTAGGLGAPVGVPGEHARTTVLLKLTTVPALDRADPGIYGGCVQQDCALEQLTWLRADVVSAPAGRTLACLPGWASVPPGYHPKQVKQYTTISIPGSVGITCGPPPRWLSSLRDLAPPSRAPDRGAGGKATVP
ncbi:MAG: hypothetical protein ACYDH5_14165 [Acidimicrobiales bacterium]